MSYLFYTETEQESYPVCLLVPTIRKYEIQQAYMDPYGLDPDDVLVMNLRYSQTKKKMSKAEMKEFIVSDLVPTFESMGVECILVADADYLKALTKAVKVDATLGYVMDCEYGPWKVIYVPNYRSIFYDPVKVTAKISQGIHALMDHREGVYTPPGQGIIAFESYPESLEDIATCLDKLLQMDCPLAIDIETFDLKHHKTGVGTIAFAWSKHEGVAFAVDYVRTGSAAAPYGVQIRNEPVRKLLKAFFQKFTQKAVYHHIAFDVYVLIYQLFMDDILDTDGLLEGMDVLLRNWDCTKLITYLATNSCSGNKLSLKDQAQAFAGNYSMGASINDITRIPLDRLLRYNLVDTLSTWYIYEKHWDTMVADKQLPVYKELFQPATVDIIQMQLTGLPVNMQTVIQVKAKLVAAKDKALEEVRLSPITQRFTQLLNEQWVEEKNLTLKKKRVTLADAKEVFNPNSAPQLQALLYGMLGLPVIDFTDSKLPSTKAKTLTDLKNHTADPDILGFLSAILDHSGVAIILETFIPALEASGSAPDGWHYLFGNFNLGGTISGRLSSSDPNLQNLPANSQYAKLIKSCIEAPPGWIFAGLDFASLEDRISALTTKDPQKLKVYNDGYDGHSLRAFAYFREQMPDIKDTVESINSIAQKYKNLRQTSKTPTFALTYAGTFATLVTNCGFSQEMAIKIETRYHELYRVSDTWVANKLKEATENGYITVAFGLRVRTPLLHQVVLGNRKTPHEAEAEGRSAGNALGQSWCLLNSRAGTEFMGKVRKSAYRTAIRPCAQIHDAQYYLIRDYVSVVAYTNEHLVKAVQWQDHPDIQHDTVKLGGELSLFWPTWAKEIGIPPEAKADDLAKVIELALAT
jgi:DNA polymerase-1